jgi:hypothetical protein
MRVINCAIFVSLISLAANTIGSAKAADVDPLKSYLDALKSAMTTLDGDLNQVGQLMKAGTVITPSAVKMINLGKEFSTLGRSSNFTNDLNTNFISGAKTLGANLTAFHTGIPAVPVGTPNLALTELNTYKLDKPLIDLDKIIKGDLADTTKLSGSLKMHLAALGADLNDAGRYAIDPSLAKDKDPFADVSAKEDLISTNVSTLPFVLFISTGAQFQSPYTVSYNSSAGTAMLTNTGNSTVPYLEVSYFDRWVMRPEGKIPSSIEQDSWQPISEWPGTDKLWGFLSRPDLEFHLGFLLASGTSSSNIPASSIAGGGDFWTDASVGFPVLRFKSSTRNQQVTINFTGGATTDKQFLSVHPFFTPGLGYQLAFKAPSALGTSGTNIAFLISKVGYGYFDVPTLSNQSNLNVTVTSLPQFQSKWAPTIGSYFAYPLGGGVFLELNVNAYFMRNPTPWNISTGVTLPLDTIGKIFH